jgi:hypothetical protein
LLGYKHFVPNGTGVGILGHRGKYNIDGFIKHFELLPDLQIQQICKEL